MTERIRSVSPFDRERRRRRGHDGWMVLLGLGLVIGYVIGRLLCAIGCGA
jgi:hypothetical protein